MITFRHAFVNQNDTGETMLSKITKNSSHRIEIIEMTPAGQGVGYLEGVPVIVERTIPGERVDIKIIKVTRNLAVGKCNKIVKPSPDRVQPVCPVFKRCGGCDLQHLSYEAQLKWKTAMVRDSFRNIGRLEDVRIHAIIGMQNPLHYRNKAQYPVGQKKGAVTIGFYAQRSHEIVEHDVCAVQDERIDRIRSIFHEFLLHHKLSVYNEERQQGLVRYLMVRVGVNTGEIMVVIVINGRQLSGSKQLVKSLLADVPGIVSVVLNSNERNTNVILGERNFVLYGKPTITDGLGNYRFAISPRSFYQVNPGQTEVLYNKALEYTGLTGKETVFDVFCGVGTIALWLAQHAGAVYGVESVAEAVKDARRNARLNRLNNVNFIAGDAETVMPDMAQEGVRPDVIVLDPPRKGCEERLLKTLISIQPERIVYVSCDPTTLARDVRYLTVHGFKVVAVQPVDMFPHTAHVECVADIRQGH
jgi:23S rRNA (uracil1939-C5)-methyltransferase